ncbi:DUF2269 family protein [Egicoccus sp. AB-alg2]|uniref:DUF2269 family protein n=1 Tax=Egicoccus sp. AB-alg2 TaxID=3242693 RepID=UPI00359EA23D
MSGYSVVVFVHVVAAIAVVGGSLFGPLLGMSVRRADDVGALRQVARHQAAVSTTGGAAAAVVLASGLFLAFRGGWWGSGWLEVSLGLFALAGVLAMGVVDPAIKRLLAALDEAGTGPVTPAVDRLRREPRATVADGVLLGVDVTIVFLMTNKPGPVGALAAAAVGLTVGGLVAARERRHDAAALADAEAAPAA